MKILVWLSGGVDSAVSALLLRDAGHEVECGFMINYISDTDDCPTRVDMEEARRVAEYLRLPFHTFDFREEYDRRIVEYIYDGYSKGLTPNPDVLCNNLVKFDVFLNEALEYGFDKIAMGHYARIEDASQKSLKSKVCKVEWGDNERKASLMEGGAEWNEAGGERRTSDKLPPTPLHEGDEMCQPVFHLLKWLDPDKDQSYFLSRLSQYQLSHALFPIGHLQKSEVREIARAAGLPNAERKDSQGLCFIGKVSMKEFLEKRLPKVPGDILDTSGKVIGRHEGAHTYTIGQRRGIEVGGGPALFVIAKDIVNNTITVGTVEELQLYSDRLTATDWHWINRPASFPLRAHANIRYRQEDQTVECRQLSENRYELQFDTPQRAITSGQIVAVYDGEELLGSGIIE